MMVVRLIFASASLLAAVSAAGDFWWEAESINIGPTTLAEDGIGPFRLGQDFQQAERLTFQLTPETAFSGLGCSGMDEIRYDARLGEHPVSIMAMADSGQILEIEAILTDPDRAENLQACLALRDHFAKAFIEKFGDYESRWQLNKPVSQEHFAKTGPVLIKARWFQAGGDCDVSAIYTLTEGTGLRSDHH